MNDELAERLDRLEKKLDTLLSMLRAQGGAGRGAGGDARASGGAPPANAGGEVASDSDLDSPRGDPEVRFVPRRWSGADNKGRRYSECEPEFLDMLAEALDWFAQRDDDSGAVDKNGNPRGRWSRLDASRARGWAARKRGQAGGGASSSRANGGANGGGYASRANGNGGGNGGYANGNGSAKGRAPSRDDDFVDPPRASHGGGSMSDDDIPF